MNRNLTTLVVASFLAAACAPVSAGPPAAAPVSTPSTRSNAPATDVEPAASSATRAAPSLARVAGQPRAQPGDFVVYRFSGSFAKAPMSLTERVVAVDGDVFVVDMTLDDGTEKEQLRVLVHGAPGARGEVMAVLGAEQGGAEPADMASFDRMLSKTTLAADQNEALLETENVAVAVGAERLDCASTTYRVRVGAHEATLRTLESQTFPWGDVGGEIIAEGGEVLYKAEVLDVGHGDTREEQRLASVTYEE